MLPALLLSCLADKVHSDIRPLPLAPLEPPAGLTLSAAGCGGCHTAIWEAWHGSGMGQAWTGPLFQAQLALDGNPICVRCHAPLHEQAPTLVTGVEGLVPLRFAQEPNPDHSPALQHEGVTCAACHLRPGGALAGPRAAGEVSAPHPVVHDTELGTAGCERCHQLAEPPLSRAARPLADTHGEHAAWGGDESCADCHMPRVEQALVTGGEVRSTASHAFPSLVGTGIELGLHEGVAVLENRAGHRVPTAEPMRAYVVRGFSGTAVEEVRLERRMDGYRDLEDTTLAPGETRRVAFSFPAERVELEYVACTEPELEGAAPAARVVARAP